MYTYLCIYTYIVYPLIDPSEMIGGCPSQKVCFVLCCGSTIAVPRLLLLKGLIFGAPCADEVYLHMSWL